MNDAKTPGLVFVYNADATLKAAAEDFITRIVAPDTYACNLCMVTYGAVAMKSPWRTFLDTLPNEKTFLHRDQFHKKYPHHTTIALPVILTNSGTDLEVLVNAEEIESVTDMEGLKKILLEKLAQANA